MIARWTVLFLAFSVALGLTAGAAAREPAPDGAAEIDTALKRVYPALVRIFVVLQEPESGRMQRMQAAGSGAIISADGYVVTNHHVAGNATRIVVNLSNHEDVDATLVGTDPLADVAVLKLKLETRKDKTPLPVATWGDSDKVRVGDVVLAMGSPGALSQSVTRGIISNTQLILPRGLSAAFRLDGEDVGSTVRWIAHDAVIYGGNSGGPLVNLAGEIIGINEIGVASLGGAIPSNLAKYIVGEILKHGDVPRSWTGMSIQPRLKDDPRTTGVLVAGVIAGSPADKAGLKSGDLILSYSGQAVSVRVAEDMPPFNQLILSTPIGQTVPIELERNGRKQTIQLTTIERQRPQGKPAELKSWGITARDITRNVMLENHLESTRGVIVDSVRAGGPNADSKLPLESGDIIVQAAGRDVANTAELAKLSDDLTAGRTERLPVLVKFQRHAREMASVVKIGKDEPEDKPARVRKAWPAMATQVLTSDLAEALGMKGARGVRVTEVFARQSAEKAGVKAGDVITAIGGVRIEASQPEDTEVFESLVRKFPLGNEVEMAILRDGKPQTLKMALEAAPSRIENARQYIDTDFEFAARDMVFDDRNRMKLDDGVAGVLVQQVEPAGWAALGGLGNNDVLISVNGKTTTNVGDLKSVLDRARKDKPRRLVFFIRRGISTKYLEIEPDWR
ncbi:MAG: PDZ domain-containing protein [Tepidisphaeraceae bacterium]